MKKILVAISMLLITVTLSSLTAALATNGPVYIEQRGLWAGKGQGEGSLVGHVIFELDGTNLIITFETIDDWLLYETHLYLGKTIPTKSAPGRFPYQHDPLPGVPSDQYTVPLGELSATNGDTLYVAAHAVVHDGDCGEETAWACGGGRFFNRAGKQQGWAMYSDFVVPEL